MLAVAYIRVSTAKQEIGPHAQREAIAQWCEKHGVSLACEPFEDHGVSGGLDFEKRPVLVEAIDALKTYNAGMLVAQKRDRIARDREVIGNLAFMLRRRGCRICTTEMPPGSPGDLDPMMKAMEGMSDVFAELERSMIRARTKAALAVKRRKGERVGTVPYGWRLLADGCRLRPDPKEQKTLRLIRRLREEGKSLRAIGAELARRGISPRGGSVWHPSTVKKIVEYNAAWLPSQSPDE